MESVEWIDLLVLVGVGGEGLEVEEVVEGTLAEIHIVAVEGGDVDDPIVVFSLVGRVFTQPKHPTSTVYG